MGVLGRRKRFEPTFIEPASPVVTRLGSAWRAVTGREATLNTATKQDSFILNNHAGIPTISFGAARFEGYGAYHQPDENIEIKFGWRCCQVVYEVVERWLAGAET